MTAALYLAAAFATCTAIAHSILSERLVLRPLRAETIPGSVVSGTSRQRLVSAMFHLPSIFWFGLAVSMLLMDPEASSSRSTLLVYATLFALSGIGNFWALSSPHPGGFMLLATAALICVALFL